MARVRSSLLLGLLIASALAGCVAEPKTDHGPKDPVERRGPGSALGVPERAKLPYDTSGDLSAVLSKGPLEMLPVQSFNVSFTLPAAEGGAALVPGGARVHIGVWMPEVPEGTKVPVIADAGPYYQSARAALASYYYTQNLIENIGPYGYAIAQVSVMGTGWSNHCMDLMGRAEQLGVDAAVTWLGKQPWSNGNVALTGKSYDGSTPWQAAMFGNPHLKTIVPSSGLIGVYDLMWRNGSAETRAPIMHNVVYGTYGVDRDSEDLQNVCPDYLTGPLHGAGAYATGAENGVAHDYWTERHFLTRVLANYKGSVLLVQGLQDWNVDPHMAFPTHHLLEAAGIEVKGMYGQWQHSWPDQLAHHKELPTGKGKEAFPHNMRYDFQQGLLEWFEYYLKGVGTKPDLRTEVQENLGQWRLETSYPPRDLTWTDVPMSKMTRSHGADSIVLPTARLGNADRREYRIAPLSDVEDTIVAGLAQFHVTVTPTVAGGQLFAQLRDATTNLRLGHAIMDLRYHDGGKVPKPVVPGMPIVAKMEFQAMDVRIPAGHALTLILTATGEDYLPASLSGPVVVKEDASSVLRLPVVVRGPDAYFAPPPWFSG